MLVATTPTGYDRYELDNIVHMDVVALMKLRSVLESDMTMMRPLLLAEELDAVRVY